MFPAFLELAVDELHLEMASREFAELELIADIAAAKDVAVGVIDVKSYYIERPKTSRSASARCLDYAPAGAARGRARLRPVADGRWAARRKLASMVEAARRLRATL